MKALEKDKGNILAHLYDYDWDGVAHDLSDSAEITVLIEYYNENKVSENAGTEDKDCAKIVRGQAERLYEQYKREHPDYANNRSSNLFYRKMHEYLQYTDTLPYAYFIALEKDGEYEEEFVEDFRQCSVKESARQQAAARNELTKAESRLSEIEKIIVKLYEEKVCGRMSEDRFELLAKNYEAEQSALKQKIGLLKAGLAEAEESDDSISKFISLVRSYTEVNELTPEILNSFIDKIYIGKPERINGQRVQEVKIVYKLVGAVNIPQ